MKKALIYTVCANEAPDSVNVEQLPIVLRFVESLSQIREELVDFVHCHNGTTGEALAEAVLGKLQQFALQEKLCGQAYNGASNMSGPLHGCAARITDVCSQAMYLHCSLHYLNLCIVALTDISLVRAILD